MHYLLALDLSHEPERIVDAASSWVVGTNHRIDLLYVPLSFPMDWGQEATSETLATLLEVQDRQRDAAVGQLQTLLERIPRDNRGEAVVTEPGNAADRVLEASKQRSAIMVGSHRRSGISRLLLGSVTDRILRLADRPVVVLHGD